MNLVQYRVLIAGLLSIPAAAYLGMQTYARLTRSSTDLNADFAFRLSMVTLVMVVPAAITFALAAIDRRRHPLKPSAKLGLTLGVMSLCLAIVPLRGLVGRMQQSSNLSAQGVAAPLFETVDLDGNMQKLADHRGKVVLINAWATWCGPCREEMPALERLYQERKDEGLMVFGLSTEDLGLQRKFVKEEVPVTYPLLTTNGNVPGMYTDIQRWPALFLVDRKGRLQPVAQGGAHFAEVVTAVESMLKAGN